MIPPHARSASTPPLLEGGPAFDRAAALARVEGDEDLLRELVDMFLSSCPRLLQDVREALNRSSADELYRAAHKLKGAVSNFVAPAATAAAQALEGLGRTGSLDGAAEAYRALAARLDELKLALADGGMNPAA